MERGTEPVVIRVQARGSKGCRLMNGLGFVALCVCVGVWVCVCVRVCMVFVWRGGTFWVCSGRGFARFCMDVVKFRTSRTRSKPLFPF